jgi:uncharacterized protein
MSASENKQLMQHIFAELSKGNSEPFVESMFDDFRWTVTGSTKWSKTYDGRQAVLTELFGTLRSKISGRMRTTAHCFIAGADHVGVEACGNNTTKKGIPYSNTYCFVFRIAEGKLKELTEYVDTELVKAALGDPE